MNLPESSGVINTMISHLFIVAVFLLSAAQATAQCNGSASMFGAYDDQQLVQILLSGNGEVVGTTLTSSMSSAQGRLYTKGNDVTINHMENRIHLLPGINSIKILDLETKDDQWSSVDVANCQPVGVAQHGPEIVGYCELNTTRSSLCVQYFRLYQRNGEWTDASRSGLCSYSLSTTTITNSVISQYLSQYGFSTKLYFAEEGTNRLHEIDLGQQETAYYDVPDHQGNVMKISRIVSMVAIDGTFAGLRLELVADNSPGVVYHRTFSSIEQHFLGDFYLTETIAFDSYDFSYLVSFSANHKTMNVMLKNGLEVVQHTLTSTLDNPIQCENIAGSLTHYLMCLAGNGLSPVLINVLNGTSNVIPIENSPIISIGALNENTVYFLNTQQVLSFYMLDNLTALHVGDYTIRHNTSLRIFNFNSSLSCVDQQSTSNNNESSITSTVVYIIVFLCCVFTGAIITTILVTGRHVWLEKLKKKSLEFKAYVKPTQLITTSSTSTISEGPESVHSLEEYNDVERRASADDVPETPPEEATNNTGGIMANRPFSVPELQFPPARIGNQQPSTPNSSEFVEADSMVSAKSCTSINQDHTDIPRIPPEGKQ